MKTPEWLKPGIYGGLVGAVAVGIIGFSWGGWVTGGRADAMATARAHDSVIAAMVPVCLQNLRDRHGSCREDGGDPRSVYLWAARRGDGDGLGNGSRSRGS